MEEYENIIVSMRGSLIELEDIGFGTQVLLDDNRHNKDYSGRISNLEFLIIISKRDGFTFDEIKDELTFIIDYMKRYRFSIQHKECFTHVSKDWSGRKRHVPGLPHTSDYISEITVKFINKFEIY